jgi:hypothetical protein
LGAGLGYTDAIVSAVHVLVSDDYDFVFVLGGNRLHRLRFGMLRGIGLMFMGVRRIFPS